MIQFVVYALFYGNHPDLAKRCLDSLRPLLASPRVEFRAGTNAACRETMELLWDYPHLAAHNLEVQRENEHKYPIMRWMFYGLGKLMDAPFVMWLDDDSYLTLPNKLKEVHAWLDEIAGLLENAALVGAPYEIAFAGNQREWVQDQPWYNGKSTANRRIKFCTGGWWCARTDVLKVLDYPWASLDHRGGDTMLGEALYQQGHRRASFRKHVCINADAKGVESRSPRRGFDSPPIGFYYDRVAAALNRATLNPPSVMPTVLAKPRRLFLELDL